MLSLASGVFGPSHNGGDAKISINAEVLKELYFPGSSRHPVIMLSEAVGDLSPKTTLPHEIQHFVGWLEHPEDYGGWKAMTTNSVSFCLGPILQIIVGVGFASSKLGKKIHRDRLLGRMVVAGSSAFVVGHTTDMLLKSTVDVHAKEKFDDDAIINYWTNIRRLPLSTLKLYL